MHPSNPKTTILIVPGAWPPAWSPFLTTLLAARYPSSSHTVSLPTNGGTSLPLATLADDIAAIQASLHTLIHDEGHDVILLCHSSGGVSGSNAVEGRAAGKKGGVARVVFFSGFVLKAGESLMGMFGGKPLPWMVVEVSTSPASVDMECLQGDRVLGDAEMLPQVGFNDLPVDEQAKWVKEMTHTSTALFVAPSGYELWANGVPCSYLFCTEDNALPLAYQQGMAQQLGPENRTANLKSGHCPFLSVPDQLLKAFEDVI
ncbi:Alpha/beta hydrolase fold-1 [Cercophora newfieldiana]|uniref:Alpha/beta hydrolase fold-1 n=1 Tax=Cercophora newfieldiana TaxID=92897 RepID=A0AA40CSJ8_9PEZI|nr:Alpha/beta hydrolase fold-1 [Cercophora newfieldiana]